MAVHKYFASQLPAEKNNKIKDTKIKGIIRSRIITAERREKKVNGNGLVAGRHFEDFVSEENSQIISQSLTSH